MIQPAPDRCGSRAARTRWRAMFLLADAVPTLLGVLLASSAVLIPGILLLLTMRGQQRRQPVPLLVR